MTKILMALAALAAATALAVPALAAPAAQTIRVTEREYTIKLSASPKAGPVTFLIRNAGDENHNFWVRGGGKTVKSRVMPGAGSARLSSRLKKGARYVFWCGVGDHAAAGMRGTFVAR